MNSFADPFRLLVLKTNCPILNSFCRIYCSGNFYFCLLVDASFASWQSSIFLMILKCSRNRINESFESIKQTKISPPTKQIVRCDNSSENFVYVLKEWPAWYDFTYIMNFIERNILYVLVNNTFQRWEEKLFPRPYISIT